MNSSLSGLSQANRIKTIIFEIISIVKTIVSAKGTRIDMEVLEN